MNLGRQDRAVRRCRCIARRDDDELRRAVPETGPIDEHEELAVPRSVLDLDLEGVGGRATDHAETAGDAVEPA